MLHEVCTGEAQGCVPYKFVSGMSACVGWVENWTGGLDSLRVSHDCLSIASVGG